MPPPQRAVTSYVSGFVVAGILAVVLKDPSPCTLALRAGWPANSCLCGKARELSVTESPAGQSPAEPLTVTLPPRRTLAGAMVSAGRFATVRVVVGAELLLLPPPHAAAPRTRPAASAATSTCFK